jgi:transposase
MKNKYLRGTRISERKFRQVLKLFCEDLELTKIANLVCLNKNTLLRIAQKFRQRIATLAENESDFKVGEIEIDESYYTLQNLRFCREPITSAQSE